MSARPCPEHENCEIVQTDFGDEHFTPPKWKPDPKTLEWAASGIGQCWADPTGQWTWEQAQAASVTKAYIRDRLRRLAREHTP